MQNQQIYTSNQETMPLVSFIITYYNLPVQMLQECIESILQLSLRPFEREIIVIDDGTYECPINDLIKYEDDIIYVRQKNSGVSTARNKGLDMAKGKFIQLIDADDCLIQAPYEQCLDIIRYKEDVDMVMFDFTNSRQVEVMLETVRPVSGATYMRNNNIHGSAWGYLFLRRRCMPPTTRHISIANTIRLLQAIPITTAYKRDWTILSPSSNTSMNYPTRCPIRIR